MSSTFDGLGLFNPGPHRFAQLGQGESLVANFVLGSGPPNGSTPRGLKELDVVVSGRVVAGSEGALWGQRDAIVAQLQHPPVTGVLVDHHGRTWAGMSFVGFEEGAQTDRGRTVSLSYRAVFRRFEA